MMPIAEKVIITNSPEETRALGMQMGADLAPGAVLCLYGDLGAGKTAFTAGLAQGLGVTDYVTSPTFTIVNEYDGRIPLFHFDVYRVYDPDELYEIGFEEYFSRGGVVCIEWADLIPSLLPAHRVEIEIRKKQGIGCESMREITIRRYEA